MHDFCANDPVYALAFSSQAAPSAPGASAHARTSLPTKLAVGSFIEGYAENYVAVVAPSHPQQAHGPDADAEWAYADDGGDFQTRRAPSGTRAPSDRRSASPMVELTRAPHQYPCTAIAFAPHSLATTLQAQASTTLGARDMLATTSDCLRLWDVVADGAGWRTAQRAALVTSKNEFAAPLTSFAWSAVDPSLVVSSSVDTTCTIWDIQAGSAITQLIAHDREVYDVSWSPASRDIFASVGADGSVRMFDIRALEHSTILYEVVAPVTTATALLRVAFNPTDDNQLAIVHADSTSVYLLDVRKPSVPVAELQAHRGAVNAFAWDEHAALATGGDDCQVLVWDMAPAQKSSAPSGSTRSTGSGSASRVVQQPALAYTAPSEVNSVVFGADWVATAAGNTVRCLQV